MGSPLAIAILSTTDALSQSLNQYLREDDETQLPAVYQTEVRQGTRQVETRQYTLTSFNSEQEFLNAIQQDKLSWDCLLFQASETLQPLLHQLQAQVIFLPAIILNPALQAAADLAIDSAAPSIPFPTADASGADAFGAGIPRLASAYDYHAATLELSITQLSQIRRAIAQAISRFIQLPPVSQPAEAADEAAALPVPDAQVRQTIVAQQQQLAEKLKERLGYLGVYYKRNPQNFLRQMTQPQKNALLKQLRADYREIILSYFSEMPDLNRKIDDFVNTAFFADVPVSQIVEIHMTLMDEFSVQLKLEGRSEEILLDYRLTLIDTIAHLCEMYRRSIPREIPREILIETSKEAQS